MSSVKLTWQYLAGFTDADGSILVYRQGAVRWQLFQSPPQEFVLYEAQKFLERQNIATKLYIYGQNKHRLEVFRYEDVEIVLKKLLPHLIIKRGKAIEALQVLQARRENRNTRCVVCHCKFPSGPRRKPRKFCSGVCRQADYRARVGIT